MINEHYLVSKYPPGADFDETWTSRSDIGGTFDGDVLTEDVYEATENRYLYAVSLFLQRCAVHRLTVLDPHVDDHAPARWKSLHDGDEISADDAVQLLRSMLREEANARLEVADSFYVHVGYDLLVWVGTSEPVPYAVDEARNIGLFVKEDSPSPQIPDPAERFWWLTDGLPVRHRVSSFEKGSGTPLDRWEIPDAALPQIVAEVPANAGDPNHWDKYVLTETQAARILLRLGATPDPGRDYTLVTYND